MKKRMKMAMASPVVTSFQTSLIETDESHKNDVFQLPTKALCKPLDEEQNGHYDYSTHYYTSPERKRHIIVMCASPLKLVYPLSKSSHPDKKPLSWMECRLCDRGTGSNSNMMHTMMMTYYH